MQHMLDGNIGIMTVKAIETGHDFAHAWVVAGIADHHCVSLKEVNYIFPMLFYGDMAGARSNQMSLFGRKSQERDKKLNFSANKSRSIFECISGTEENNINHLFYYIYAILYSRSYRNRYREFLKREFPRIPIPGTDSIFLGLTNLGRKLIDLHVLNKADTSALKNPAVSRNYS